ncbi:MAG TPA: PEP-CTERM sorting domain-containing protein, partial [Acetobacteraceae bacterium]|nr:PEP-CTERM sorting domain-containing protein [Acetobacteraceae bacterium]
FESGDFGGDDDIITATAYSGLGGTGSVVATSTILYPVTLSFPTDRVLFSLSGGPFQSVVLLGGSAIGPHSVYYDFFTATFEVPEPGTLGLVLAGLLGLVLIRRRFAGL